MNPDTYTENAPVAGGSKMKKIILILVIIMVAASLYFYLQVRTLQQDPKKADEQKVAALVAKVSKIISLPEGETPVVATVSDTAPLKNNPFFANAKVGDQVILYTAARRAFLYDPAANIIVEVASLNIGQ